MNPAARASPGSSSGQHLGARRGRGSGQRADDSASPSRGYRKARRSGRCRRSSGTANRNFIGGSSVRPRASCFPSSPAADEAAPASTLWARGVGERFRHLSDLPVLASPSRPRRAPPGRCCDSRCTGRGCLRDRSRTCSSVGSGFSAQQATRPPSPCRACRTRTAGRARSRNAPCIGCSSPSGRQPLAGGDLGPSACAASTVQDFTDSPSSRTVHAPQDVVSQPMFVPRQPRPRARGARAAAGARLRRLDRAPVDGNRRPSPALCPALRWIAAQTRSGVAGMSIWRTPRWARRR